MTDKKTTSYSSLKGFRRAIPIILVAVALFIGLCFVTQESGSVGRAISGVLLGLFSWGAYSIPVLIALHALFYPSDVGEKRVVSRIIFSAVAVVSLSDIEIMSILTIRILTRSLKPFMFIRTMIHN